MTAAIVSLSTYRAEKENRAEQEKAVSPDSATEKEISLLCEAALERYQLHIEAVLLGRVCELVEARNAIKRMGEITSNRAHNNQDEEVVFKWAVDRKLFYPFSRRWKAAPLSEAYAALDDNDPVRRAMRRISAA